MTRRTGSQSGQVDRTAGAIYEDAVRPQDRTRLGSLLAEIGRKAKLSDEVLLAFEQRDRTSPSPISLG